MDGEGDLVHLVREAGGEPAGALILLHGRGTDETDLFPLLDELDPERNLLGLTVGGPITNLPPGGRHWYAIEQVGHPNEETFLETMELLCRFLDDFLRGREIPWERTVIGGFSMGGAVALSVGLAAERPLPAGIMALSCFLPTVDGWRLDLPGKRPVKVWISHGSFDNIIPVDFGRRSRDVLEKAGFEVSYRESRMAHGIDPELLPELRQWLRHALAPEEERGPTPVV